MSAGSGFSEEPPTDRSNDAAKVVGRWVLRSALYFPALTAARYNPPIRALSERLSAKGKCKLLIIGAAMCKLLHLVYGVLKSGKPFDPVLAAART